MKHAMAGTNIWNSLTSDFQLELLGQELIFNWEDEYDGMELWDHIRAEVNPSTKVGAYALKEDIESKTLQHFGMDVKAFNIWLIDTKKEIARQEEPEKYNEYIWYAFKTYLTFTNQDFNESIKDVKRRWTQYLLPSKYYLMDLMTTALKRYINSVADGGWTLSERGVLQRTAQRPSYWHCLHRSKHSRKSATGVVRRALVRTK